MLHRPHRPFALLLFAPILGCGDPSPGDDSGGSVATASSSSSASTTDTSTDTSTSTTDTPTTGAEGTTGGSSGESSGGPVAGLELLVCSFLGDSVGRFDLATGAFLGDLGPTDDLDGALGVTVGPDGQIYVASEEANMVLRYDGVTGAFVERFVWDDPNTPDDESGGLKGPGAVLFGADGQLYVSSFDSDAILRYDGATGAFVDVFVTAGAGGLNGPDAGMVFGPDGHLYVPGFYSNSVARFDKASGMPLGDFTPMMDNKLDAPRTLVFHGDHLYVANEGSDEILRYDASSGDFVDVFVAAGAGGLDAPAGMVFDEAGQLHVASLNNNTVLRFDAAGAPLPSVVDGVAGGIDGPTHITLAPGLP